MPVRSSEGIVSVEGALRSSLGVDQNEPHLDQKLLSSSKRILLHKIEFKPAERHSSFPLDNLRAKYKPLNPSKKPTCKVEVNGLSLKTSKRYMFNRYNKSVNNK